MTITKDQMARDLVDKTGYYLKDVKALLSAMDDLFEEYNRPIVVVTFLSILEMVKEKDVVINQDKNFDKILIELRN